jgi:IgGFc binding protein
VGTGCVPQVCSPNQRFCSDPQSVAQCDALGASGQVVDRCSGNSACAAGSCIDSCQAADINKSFAGCTFYSVDMDNYDVDDANENDIAVANQSNFTATVKIQVRQSATAWTTLCMAGVPAGQTHVFPLTSSCAYDQIAPLDRHVEDSALRTALAYRVISDAPIVAYQYNSDDLNGSASSSGASVLLPKATLGKKYYVLTWPQPDPASSFNLSAPDIARSAADIVATADSTNVTVTSSTHIMMGDGVPAMNPGDTHTFTLNEGDVLQLETQNIGDDLTGTYVEGDKPIAVFAGVECAVNLAPGMATDGYCDHIEEQLLPLVAWGKNYVAARVIAQENSDGCDGAGTPETACPPSRWRVLASVDATTVTFSPPAGVTLQYPGSPNPIMLDAGQFIEVLALGSSATAPGDFYVSADQAILVMQLSGGEATMTTTVPVDQYLANYLFEATDYFCSNLTVVRKQGAVVQVNGMTPSNSLFNPAGGTYEVARYPLNQMACGVGNATGAITPYVVHAQSGAEGMSSPVGIIVSGMDFNCSYAYVGGLNVNAINPVE